MKTMIGVITAALLTTGAMTEGKDRSERAAGER